MTDEELNNKEEEILGRMSLRDKIALCSGRDFWHTKDFEQYGIPSIMLTDGPHGLRKQQATSDMLGIHQSVPATAFPTAVTSGATWNVDLLYEEGKAIGEEARKEQVGVVLGPGVNIKRNPLCGCNFEYFSEDPLVAGEMGAAFVQGMQKETGVGACVKHFAANSQEYKRFHSDSRMDERTLREIYLPAFEKVVKKAQPSSLMCSYNRVNGTYSSDHKRLLTDILRSEWGFHGMVVTDWGALNDRTAAFAAGCDLAMPGGSAYGEKEAARAVRKGKLDEAAVNESARRVLLTVLRENDVLKASGEEEAHTDTDAHDKLAQKIAEEGAVLLRNEGDILPIKDMSKTLLVGAMAEGIRYQGAGSSHIVPTRLVGVRDALPNVQYVAGCDEKGNVTEESLAEVRSAAAHAESVVVFAGLTDAYESEGFDRTSLELLEGHNRMIEAALDVNPNVVVVLMGGSVMNLPWEKEVRAILYTGLCGQSGGRAIANLLTGEVNPSGKLTETWPLRLTDVPSYGFYGRTADGDYREGIYVGYRYYDKAGKTVRYPFGYGLSYTKFTYSNLLVKGYTVSCSIANTGRRAGSEVVELYIGNPQNGIHRPVKELRGFQKVFLRAGEIRTVEFTLTGRDFAVYDNGWKIPTGTYEILIGSSSQDIRLTQTINVVEEEVVAPSWQKGSWYERPMGQPTLEDFRLLCGGTIREMEKAEPGHFSINNSILEMAPYSKTAGMIMKRVKKMLAAEKGGPLDENDPETKMALASSLDATLRAMMIFTPKFRAWIAKRIVREANRGKRHGT